MGKMMEGDCAGGQEEASGKKGWWRSLRARAPLTEKMKRRRWKWWLGISSDGLPSVRRKAEEAGDEIMEKKGPKTAI